MPVAKLIAILLLLFFLFVPSDSGIYAQSGSQDIEQRLDQKKRQLQDKKKSITELSQKEKKLYSNLADIEGRIKHIEKRLQRQKKDLERIKEQESELKEQYADLQDLSRKNQKELHNIIEHLWPVYLRQEKAGVTDFQSWEEADRFFTWFKSIYDLVSKKWLELMRQKQALELNLKKQQKIRRQVAEKVEGIQSTKEELLEQRLIFVNKVQKVRAERVAREEQLARIRDTIEDLEYKLKIHQSHKISDLKGSLLWPAQGKVVASFDSSAEPPLEGIGFSLSKSSKIRSISWGKVVYNDKLRGFGRVVIIYHGEHYYSLYAFLSESKLKVGQNVAKGDILGIAGFYPESKGPGLYFELRLGQNPINPEPWLKSRAEG